MGNYCGFRIFSIYIAYDGDAAEIYPKGSSNIRLYFVLWKAVQHMEVLSVQ